MLPEAGELGQTSESGEGCCSKGHRGSREKQIYRFVTPLHTLGSIQASSGNAGDHSGLPPRKTPEPVEDPKTSLYKFLPPPLPELSGEGAFFLVLSFCNPPTHCWLAKGDLSAR
jgi:hypothetical protein